MKNALLFGTAYYPEYLPYERIRADFAMMKEAGMNVVRIAESTWSTLEPEEGVFDFSVIDAVLEEAQEQDMQVIVGTPTYALPPWLVKRDPDVLVTGKDGRADYGARQLINLLNPGFRQAAERVIRALAAHTAGHCSVIGYQIDNETKHYENYGIQAQALFRKYLQDKFQTTENLNHAFHLAYWSNSVSSWEDFPDMRGCINGGLAAEYERFLRQMAADYLCWQAGLLREYLREDQFLTQNFDFEWKRTTNDITRRGYSYGVQPDMNHLEASRCLTLAGTDIYHPSQDDFTGAEIAFGGDSIRSLKHDSYLNLEVQAQGFKEWTPYPGQLRLAAYSHLASGSLGLLYWHWHSLHNGPEACWRGILSHDLGRNPVYDEIAEIGKEWGSLGPDSLILQKKNEIALVVDNASLTALRYFPIDEQLSYNDIVRWMYDSLYEMNLECDVVDVQDLHPEEYRVILTPALYSVSEETVSQLVTFVANGGILISSFRSFVADSHLSIFTDSLPHGLTDVFGMRYHLITAPGSSQILEYPVQYFQELLQPEKGEILAAYKHPYWSDYAGITRHTYGKGCAYYIGCYTDREVLKRIYREAMDWEGVSVPNAVWPVIVRSGVNRKGEPLHYVLHYSAKKEVISCPFSFVRDLLTGKKYREGDLIALPAWSVLALREIIL